MPKKIICNQVYINHMLLSGVSKTKFKFQTFFFNKFKK